MSLAFHAAPPPGEWFNDPNALIHDGDAYRLLVQHRSDGPAYRATGWARLSSANLLDWRYDGVVLPPVGDLWAYSGSVVAAGALEAFHTVHDAATGLEAQRVAVSGDGGATWRLTATDLTGPPVRNARDPFVFADGDGWSMLLAEPCDWTDWPTEPPSRLRRYRSTDRRTWRDAGTIGPWSPPGVMWEVPVLARLGDTDLLLISQVDRRGGGAAGSVRAWAGRLGDPGFMRADDWPADGVRVDLGPDFYACMVAGFGASADGVTAVAWASSWQTARAAPWPGFAGGPISLPRRIAVAGQGQLSHRPLDAVVAAFARPVAAQPIAGMGVAQFDGDAAFELSIGAVRLAGDPGTGALAASRTAGPPFAWQAEYPGLVAPAPTRQLRVFSDGPLLEIFLDPEGLALTICLPLAAPITAILHVAGRAVPIEWYVRP